MGGRIEFQDGGFAPGGAGFPGETARRRIARSSRNFCKEASAWLDDYALFMALKDAHQGTAWTGWARADSQAGRGNANEASGGGKLAPQLMAYKYWQFEFFPSVGRTEEVIAGKRGIRFHGRHSNLCLRTDSADVWANPELFLSGRAGKTDRGFWRAAGLFSAPHGTALGANPILSLGAVGR